MVVKLTNGLNKQTRYFTEWNDTISNKIEALRNKITQAHHIANSVRRVHIFKIDFSLASKYFH